MNTNEKNSLKEFGKLVKERRRKLGLSQEKLAELCGLSTRQITKTEKGNANMKLINLIRICVELDIDIGELDQFYTFPEED